MKTKKWIRMLSIVAVITMMAGMITGCQGNISEEILKEISEAIPKEISQVVSEEDASPDIDENVERADNTGEQPEAVLQEDTSMEINAENMESTGNPLQTARMDACLNLDLGMFIVFGKPLGDWTYEELCDYIYTTYEESYYREAMYDPYTGAKMRGFYDPKREKFFISITEGHSVCIREDQITYTMNKFDWCRSHWNLTAPYNPNSKDIVATICGQRVDTYLESVCPGLYAELQKEPTISLKDGLAMMDSLSNGTERISLCVVGGNLELGYQDGVIDSLTLFFTEPYENMN